MAPTSTELFKSKTLQLVLVHPFTLSSTVPNQSHQQAPLGLPIKYTLIHIYCYASYFQLFTTSHSCPLPCRYQIMSIRSYCLTSLSFLNQGSLLKSQHSHPHAFCCKGFTFSHNPHPDDKGRTVCFFTIQT